MVLPQPGHRQPFAVKTAHQGFRAAHHPGFAGGAQAGKIAIAASRYQEARRQGAASEMAIRRDGGEIAKLARAGGPKIEMLQVRRGGSRGPGRRWRGPRGENHPAT
jgi:hypothetical protein